MESGGGTGTAEHQEPPQRRRAARRPEVRAGRAAAHAVQGRGARGRRRARAARGDRCAAAVPGPGTGYPDHRRGHPGPAGDAARGRRDRPRGADRGRPGRADLAVPGGAAGRRPLGRRAGRRPHLRPPDRAAPGVQRGRDDRRLDAAALRRAGADLHPDHQRGARGQPGGARRHQQAAGHHRVGVNKPGARQDASYPTDSA